MPELMNALGALRGPAVIVAALALAPGPAELDAQAAAGATVRITIGQAKGIYQLQAIRGDTVFVQEYDATRGIPLSRIDRIEVGTRRGPGRIVAAALLGAGFGAAAGAALGLVSGDDCDGTRTFCFGWSAEEKATAGAVILGAVGGIGGSIMAARSPWSWKRVGPDDLAIRAAPSPGGLSLRVSFKPARSTPRARPEPAMNPAGHDGIRD